MSSPSANRPVFSLESLKEGIYLEHLDKTLEWYTNHREARFILGMEMGRPDKVTLSWENNLALGGLTVEIAGKFIVDPSVDPNLRSLRLIEFRVYKQEDEPVDRLYKRIKSHLKRHLGDPSLEYDGEEESSFMRSFTEWESNDVMVMWKITKLETEEVCVGEVWSKPFPKEYLKLTLTSF